MAKKRSAARASRKSTKSAKTRKSARRVPTLRMPRLNLRTRLSRLRSGASWLREMIAVLLIVFGMASLLTLLGLAAVSGALAESWREALRQTFGGFGAAVVMAALVALGLFLLVPLTGSRARVTWQRVLALQCAFAAFLAVAHLLSARPPDPRMIAERGEGGGYIGWVLAEPVAVLLGPLIALVVWLIVLALAVGMIFGLRLQYLRAGLRALASAADRLARAAHPSGQHTSASPSDEQPRQPPPEPHVRLRSPGPPGERESIVPRGLSMLTGRSRRRQQRGFDLNTHTDTRKVARRGERLPPMDLLDSQDTPRQGGRATLWAVERPSEKEIKENAQIIRETLADFDIDVEVIGVKVGPTVTQYAVQPYIERQDDAGNLYLQRVRVRRIAALAGDLALALSARRLRVEAPVPGTSYVGVEVPNRQPSLVKLRPLLESESFYSINAPLALPLGRDVSGAPVIANLASMPHLLISGTTGSGKSVAITAMVTALVMNNTPDDLNLILLDPKMVELARFNGLPHLLGPVETDMERIVGVLRWATTEMDRRYRVLEAERARNIEIYNQKLSAQGKARADDRLPYIVIFIDEIGDLMLSMPDETEETLCRLAQMARAVGMLVVMATQRPSTDIITGLIKANFPARISFAVASGIDSRVILDTTGAESLLGNGDMLFLPPEAPSPRRVQSCFVSDEEVTRVVEYWDEQYQAAIAAGEAEPPGMAPWERGLTRREILAETDPMLEEAIEIVVAEGKASASLLQRRLGVGYPRAARIIDFLEELGVVGSATRGGVWRPVLIKPGDDTFYEWIDRRARAKHKGR